MVYARMLVALMGWQVAVDHGWWFVKGSCNRGVGRLDQGSGGVLSLPAWFNNFLAVGLEVLLACSC